MSSIFVCVPAYGHQINAHCVSALMALMPALGGRKVHTRFATMSMVDIADVRNIFTTLWYQATDTTHLLFVDADMAFAPELVLDMLDFDKPVVGCIYPTKTLPIGYVGGVPVDTTPLVQDGHMRVTGVGGGVLLIKREVIAELIEADPALLDTNIQRSGAGKLLGQHGTKSIIRCFDKLPVENGLWLSEDMAFCRRWTDHGGEIWANINHPVTHVGYYGFTGRYADTIP